ncbi:MAG: M23 family metallopeptidase [Chloroflexota bacterium]|nr:M23 family metallopeptidase [Chloroflexota bacterium]
MDNPEEKILKEQEPAPASRWSEIWNAITHAGLAELFVRLGTHVLLVALILVVAWGLREFYRYAQVIDASSDGALAAAPATTPTPTEISPRLPDFSPQAYAPSGVSRQARIHTDVPSRPRTELIIYTVQTGDTLFGIADKFGLNPETILWGNQFTLGDNPHNLRPGQDLNILPIDGTYHRWSQGDGLNGVAKFFSVSPQIIIDFPGNNLDPDTIGDWSNPDIEAGTWLVIPGGSREFVSWSAPEIPREDPSVARVLGPGVCESVSTGAIGIGTFVWPADKHTVSGFDFNPNANHSGIDIDGGAGDNVYAADSGVVVYAGWNNWGYGNVLVVNHGNGWQTLYAHLNALYAGCGESVFQGSAIGAIGSTGNSTGPHLHYEMMYNGVKVNPWDYLP